MCNDQPAKVDVDRRSADFLRAAMGKKKEVFTVGLKKKGRNKSTRGRGGKMLGPKGEVERAFICKCVVRRGTCWVQEPRTPFGPDFIV